MEQPITIHTKAIFESLEPITSYPVRLNDALWPSCKLCGCKPNYCQCDPEEARLALIKEMLS